MTTTHADPVTTSPPEARSLLRVRDLTVDFVSTGETVPAVRGVDLDLSRGEVLGIVGESGSGKSVTASAIMGLLPRTARTSGSATLEDTDLLGASDSTLNGVRGSRIAMIFQDPMTSLNPVLTVGHQIVEAIRTHRRMPRAQARQEAVELLQLVGIHDAENRADNYPHEFSGGMRQRVVIAIAMANRPDVIIADEPTTALDVTVQTQVLDALEAARRHVDAAMILITHDLGVIAGHADRVQVMYGGRVAEEGSADTLFHGSRMPYTRGLLAAMPRLDHRDLELTPIPGSPPSPQLLKQDPCPFAPRCTFATERCRSAEPPLVPVGRGHRSACHYADDREHLPDLPPIAERETVDVPRASFDEPALLEVTDLEQTYTVRSSRRGRRTVHAVNGVSLQIAPGETVGLVGESGCGKSSVSRSVARLQPMTSGEVRLAGEDWSGARGRDLTRMRHLIQMVFQDPHSSLDPRLSVAQIIEEALRLSGVPRAQWRERVTRLLVDVGLSPGMIERYPHEFSGGQRQRLGVARALATEPKVLVLDEPVSALDVSVQAGVVNMLQSLQRERGLSYLFIAHDLSVVAHISHRIAVMYLGRIVEIGPTDTVLTDPSHPYTSALISAVPIPDPRVERGRARVRLDGDPRDPGQGCPFRNRCPVYRHVLGDDERRACDDRVPELSAVGADERHCSACFYPDRQPPAVDPDAGSSPSTGDRS